MYKRPNLLKSRSTYIDNFSVQTELLFSLLARSSLFLLAGFYHSSCEKSFLIFTVFLDSKSLNF